MIGKLVKFAAAAVAGYAGYRWYEKRKAAASGYPLVGGTSYAVHLQYAGAGAGGAPTQAGVSNLVNANMGTLPGSASVMAISTQPTVDPVNKVISFTLVPPNSGTLANAILSSNWPAPWAPVSVLSVQNVGSA